MKSVNGEALILSMVSLSMLQNAGQQDLIILQDMIFTAIIADEKSRLLLKEINTMEDRYLCKAKRTDNGEWVIGYVVKYGYTRKEKYYIVPDYASDLYAIEVDPSTICWCTGLKDKNNKLVWENDIVKFDTYCYEKLASSIISQIKWCNDLCALSLVVNNRGTRGTLGHLLDLNNEGEVVGNIFDNPDLLESEK